MGIAFVTDGICKDCPFIDLTIDEGFQYECNNKHCMAYSPSVHCVHENACARAFEEGIKRSREIDI